MNSTSVKRAGSAWSERRVEAFLLDFEGDLYGRRVIVELWERLRDEAVFESEADLMCHFKAAGVERLRPIGAISLNVRAVAHEAGVPIVDAPVVASGRLELRWYLREQTVSRIVHRYGNLIPVTAKD